jgi:hypothetical protein
LVANFGETLSPSRLDMVIQGHPQSRLTRVPTSSDITTATDFTQFSARSLIGEGLQRGKILVELIEVVELLVDLVDSDVGHIDVVDHGGPTHVMKQWIKATVKITRIAKVEIDVHAGTSSHCPVMPGHKPMPGKTIVEVAEVIMTVARPHPHVPWQHIHRDHDSWCKQHSRLSKEGTMETVRREQRAATHQRIVPVTTTEHEAPRGPLIASWDPNPIHMPSRPKPRTPCVLLFLPQPVARHPNVIE